MERVSILYVTDVFLKLAGAERNLFEVVTRIDFQKYRPLVLCFEGGGILNLLKQKGIETINLRLKKIYSPKAILTAVRIFKLLRQRNVKIVVTYHESSDFFISIIAKLSGVPVIISSRRDMGYKLKPRHIFIYKFIDILFDRIITVSDAVKNEIFEREDVFWHKLVTIHNGVELEKFNLTTDKNIIKKSLGLNTGIPIVGILATLRPIKGHKYFIEAAALILKEFPETYFLIIGWPENQNYYTELKELTKQLKIEKNVLFIGGRADAPEMLSIIDISVLSSINEGFPNAVLESMAAGKPVVATDGGGTQEAVINDKTGLLVPPRDSEALAKAILKLLHNQNLADFMGKEGKNLVKQEFSMVKMIRNLENLYQNLLFEKKITKEYTQRRISVLIQTCLKRVITHYVKTFFLINKILSSSHGINILAYHRVNNDCFDPLNMNIEISTFEKQIRYIKRHYKVITLSKAVEILKEHKEIPENLIVITFDDGYKDFYLNAYPILSKYKIPAVLFLSIGAIEQKHVLWFDTVVSVIKMTKKEDFDLTKVGLRKFAINSVDNKKKAINEIVCFLKRSSLKERNNIVSYLFNESGCDSNEINSSNPLLDWEELKSMNNELVAFGSHGMTHTILQNLDEKEIENEIVKSKEIMKVKTGLDIHFFSYPNGGINDFKENVKQQLAENAYIAACTLIKGSNNGSSDLFALKRICMNNEITRI
jgi:glycosyltransferase involved in cell wall biosynthesis/peptidoglycan/xylan/chitin deacetylase (PgdA/CDA1 family)